MSKQERYGTRDLAYSAWHRPPNLPEDISYIDIDCCEYCNKCKRPLALVELAQDVGQAFKPTTVIVNLARISNLPAWLVFYKKNGKSEIVSMRVRQMYPDPTRLVEVSPESWKIRLIKLHREHTCRSGING